MVKNIIYSKENPLNISDMSETDIKNLNNRTGYIFFICKKCNKQFIKQFRKGRMNNMIIKLCYSCLHDYNMILTHGENYGKKRQLKAKQTMLEIYGIENYNNREKAKQTFLEKYGVIHPSLLPEIKEKIKQSYTKEKRKIAVEKGKKTNLKRYGGYAPICNEKIKNKIKKTNLEKYGFECPFQNKEVYDKVRKTNLERYGSLAHPNVGYKRYIYKNIKFDSSWELYFYIWLEDRNFNFEYHTKRIYYKINDINHVYTPDFYINGKFYEIKGDQFFNEKNEPYNHYKKEFWWDKYNMMIDNNVCILREKEMEKYFEYVNNTYSKNYILQFKC